MENDFVGGIAALGNLLVWKGVGLSFKQWDTTRELRRILTHYKGKEVFHEAQQKGIKNGTFYSIEGVKAEFEKYYKKQEKYYRQYENSDQLERRLDDLEKNKEQKFNQLNDFKNSLYLDESNKWINKEIIMDEYIWFETKKINDGTIIFKTTNWVSWW